MEQERPIHESLELSFDTAEEAPPPQSLRRTASLEPLLEYWESVRDQEDSFLAPLAQRLLAAVEEEGELTGVLSAELCRRHQELFEALLISTVPGALQRRACAAVVSPLEMDFFYATPRFRRELLDSEGRCLSGRLHLDGRTWGDTSDLFYFLRVARDCYGLDVSFKKSVTVEKANPETGLSRFFQLRFHADHLRIRVDGRLTPLSPEQLVHLTQNLDDLSVWRSMIPYRQIEIYGLSVIEAFEITEEMCLSAIKQELVTTNSLRSSEHMTRVQQQLRQLLEIPDLWLGLGGVHEGQTLMFSPEGSDRRIEPGWAELPKVSTVLGDDGSDPVSVGTKVIVDLSLENEGGPLLNELKQRGQRSALVIPLALGDSPVGFLLCSSASPGIFTPLAASRLHPVLTQIAWAVKRAISGIDTRVQAVMKERFTVLHPSVEWRFRETALRVVQGGPPEDDVVFSGVYPLYGVSDVRQSTVTRNRAIAADFKTQLKLAENALVGARKLAYIDSLVHRIGQWRRHLDEGITSEDETAIIEWLKTEVEVVFPSAAESEAVAAYRASLDPKLGLVYQERKRYEDSMALLKDCIADTLTEAQQEVQAIHPHYFELRMSDGVDHTLYTGPAIAPDGRFDPVFLKNLRLWQLQTMAEIARRCTRLTTRMPLLLETAHLILVQDSPLSIRFSSEEKQFNVDGAYNARYEILKKRIDKAEIRGTGERLTQPGKIAIVYSHPREAAEYRYFIDYLQNIGQLSFDAEEVELGPLQGVVGLRAIRVSATSI